MPTRRGFSSLLLTLGASHIVRSAFATETSQATPKPPELTLHELTLPGPGNRGRPARRALVLVPAHGPPGQTHPGIVLLHGRGEVGNDLIGIHAWHARYGLADSYSRLLRAPLSPSPELAKFMRNEQLDALNSMLSARPFRGLVMICPVTPNPNAGSAPERTLDDYAAWLEHTLLPAAREVAPLGDSPLIGLDGCSMGGYVAAEVFARKPHLFRTFGVVQPAIGQFRVGRYARALAEARSRLAGIHLLTSSHDPYREVTEALGRELERLGARPTLQVLPGPHDQNWLRAAGTLTLLGWHDQRLRAAHERRVL